MKKTEKEILIEGLRKLSVDMAEIADALEGKTEPEHEAVTFEEVRALLADKARAGYRAEVKSLLTAHGVEKLSDITDPTELAAIVAEAEVIGNG